MSWNGTWTTAADLQGRLPRNILSQLRGALAERASVVASPPTLPGELTAGLKPGASWFTAFQAAMSNLIPKYANHQTNGGDYEGLTAIPMWSESDILTAISASSRLPAPSSGLLVREWAWQQYAMLNLLRWLPIASSTVAGKQKTAIGSASYSVPTPPEDAKTDCETNYAAASESTSKDWTSYEGWYNVLFTISAGYRIYVSMGKTKILASNMPGSLSAKIYMYAKAVIWPQASSPVYSRTFSDAGLGLQEDALALMETVNEFNSSSSDHEYTPASGSLPRVDNPPPVPPSSDPPNLHWDYQSSSGFAAYMLPVRDYTITNGFTYKDW